MEALTPKQEFLNELDNFIKKLDEIDKKTPWKPVEPIWWCDLADLSRQMIKIKQKHQ